MKTPTYTKVNDFYCRNNESGKLYCFDDIIKILNQELDKRNDENGRCNNNQN